MADPLGRSADADVLGQNSRPDHIHAVVVLTEFDGPARRALRFAEALRPETLVAVNVCLDATETSALMAQWARRRIDIPLKCIYPTAEDTDPVVHHVDSVRHEHPAGAVVVILPVVTAARWWQRPLHRLADPTLPRRLSQMDRVMIAEVPWQLDL